MIQVKLRWWQRVRSWIRHTRVEVRAPRPHTLTIITSLLSPLIALIAVGFAYSSYQTAAKSAATAQDSLRIAQRADLVIRNARLVFVDRSQSPVLTLMGRPDPDVLRRRRVGDVIMQVSHRFEVHNLGNTRAKTTGIEMIFIAPKGWERLQGGRLVTDEFEASMYRFKWVQDVEQHGVVAGSLGPEFILSKEASTLFRRAKEEDFLSRPSVPLDDLDYVSFQLTLS